MKEDRQINQKPKRNPFRHPGIIAMLGCWQDWALLAGLFLTEGIVVWAVQQARWINPQPSLVVTLLLALIVALVLVRSRLHTAVSHSSALVAGLLIVFLQGILLFPDSGLAAKSGHLIRDINAWWRTVQFGEPSPGTIHIALVFGYLAWIIGYFSAWNILKKRGPWVAIALSTVTILVTLNYQGRDKYYLFVLFVFSALLLLALTNFLRQSSRTANRRQGGFRRGWIYWSSVAICIMLLTVFFSWNAPQLRISRVEAFARDNNPWREKIDLYWQNFFAPVPGSVAGLAHGGQSNIQFGGSLELSDQVVFTVYTSRSSYWKTQIYDYYDTTGWKTSNTRATNLDKGEINTGLSPSTDSSDLSYTLVPQVNTNVLLTPGELVTGDMVITKKDLTPVLFTFSLTDSSKDGTLPPDIASIARNLRAASINRYRNSNSYLISRLPSGIKLVDVERSNNQITNVTITRAAEGDEDTVSLSSTIAMLKQKSYQITVRISEDHPADELMAAGDNYPRSITDRYLQLPTDFPAQIIDLARSLTNDLDNAYAKALVIKYYLSKIPYSLKIEAPPEGADGVDYFLFTQKSGYCVYFASAMTVMLRSAGVPARMVVGFAPGQFDSQEQRFLIRDRDYHAWTEVFFPAYGWVMFDPTPSSSVSDIPIGAASGAYPDYSLDWLYEDPGVYGSPINGSSSPSATPTSYAGYIATSVSFAILMAVFIAWFVLYRRPSSNSSLYPRMVALASLAGMGPRRGQTSLEFSNELARSLPQCGPDISSITSVYIDVRFGKRPLDSSHRNDLTNAWRSIRRILLKRTLRLK